MIDDEIKTTRAALAVARKARIAAVRLLKKAERDEEVLQNRLDSLKFKRDSAKLRKEDLAGKNGPVFELTSTPRTLFEKQRKQKFVLASSEWLLGGNYRFRARKVADVYGGFGSLIFDVTPKGVFVVCGDRDTDWFITRDEALALLAEARDFPRKEAGRSPYFWAYSALELLDKKAA